MLLSCSGLLWSLAASSKLDTSAWGSLGSVSVIMQDGYQMTQRVRHCVAYWDNGDLLPACTAASQLVCLPQAAV